MSVLFADLVGFTTLSESRDPEDVRELLTRVLRVCRTLVVRHGGAVEKFIGDAVMAVWGAPVAHEDDAERAVRAALELVAAVTALGEEVGAPELQVRAGVLTGEAAVTLGAAAKGMVAGDLVNTAAGSSRRRRPGRCSSTTPPGARRRPRSLRGRRRAHELKGKAEPVALLRALQVVAGRGGASAVDGLEAPFLGRDHELRMLKDLFHATVDHRRPSW